MAYQQTYRRGMHQQYGSTLRDALLASGQQARLSGRPLSEAEIAEIAKGVLQPYLSPYGPGLEAAREMDIEQQQINKDLALEKERLRQEEKAEETQAVGQAGTGVLMSGQLYEKYYGSGGGGGAAGGGAGGGEGGTTSGGGGGWGNAFAFVGGGTTGYAASPYGQQLEEGTGRPGRIPMKAAPGGHSRRGGERLGMMGMGALAGGAVTGGNPYGAAGGAIGGYLQENPETGKRGYQETYSWYIKPAWKGAVHDIKSVGELAGKAITDPTQVVKRMTNVKKGWKRVKKLF